MNDLNIDDKTLATILDALREGARVELTPTRDGVLVFIVKRKKIGELNQNPGGK